MKRVEVAVIGAGWCGGIRAETLARSALVDKLHICEIRPERLAEVKALTNPATATLDYKDITGNPDIAVVYISTTPETNHYPIARDCLAAGKHVLLEKPIALELSEADELIALARRNRVKFTIGYSQRFNPKFAYAKKKITDGTLGKVVNVMVSRHITRGLGKKIGSRGKLSPVVMESTHDLDFVLAAGAGQAHAHLLPGCLWRDEGGERLLRLHVDHDQHGRRLARGDRRRLEPAAGLSEFLRHLARDHRHRGCADPGRHPPGQLAEHRAERHAVPDVDDAGRACGPRVRRADGAGDDPLPRILPAGPTAHGRGRARAHGHGDLSRRGSFRRAERAGGFPAVEFGDGSDSQDDGGPRDGG